MGKRTEREFFDGQVSTRSRRALGRYYAVMRNSTRDYRRRLARACPGKRVLEFGCGVGSEAINLAASSRHVCGIDISPAAVRKATERAARQGLTNCRFMVMDAESTAFPTASFDLVCGTGIIHHLDVERSLDEIARLLRPGGVAIFMEPLGHNPFLNLFRRLTPSLRTPDEHPLRVGDLVAMRSRFPEVSIRYWHLLAWLSIPFLPWRRYHDVLAALDRADQILFKAVPFLRPWAWYTVIVLSDAGGRLR